jgi:ornithine cyclodeaminase/alanine dehydrogenase-like protein (mu-crystallin family)
MTVGTRLLRADDMVALFREVGRDALMDLMIEELRRTFRDHRHEDVEARTRDGFQYTKPDLGLLEWMPTHEIGGPVVVKMVGYHPTNPVQRGLPSVIATSSLWDTTTGELLAIADATLLTAVRTGAASGLATDVLAVDAPVEVGVVGLGAQAVTQLHAISRVREITRVRAHDDAPEAAETFADRIAFLGLDVEIVGTGGLRSLVAESDVLVTCTSVDIGAGPVVPAEPGRPWLHVNAVGADFAGKIELPREMLERATVFPDSRPQCIAEGECQQLAPEAIGPELVEVIKAEADHRRYRDERTVFDSTGWAVEDDVALRLALRLAEQHDLGSSIQIECVPSDPRDPYSFASTPDAAAPRRP